MDMMLLGEALMGKGPGGTTVDYYGFWMPASGTNGVGAWESTLVSGTVTANIMTKSSGEVDSAEVSAISGPVTVAVGRQEVKITNAKDLVRYKFTLQGSGYLHCQCGQPLWLPN